ncbi:MAG: hypothetical protein WKG07_00125 [Hymenobacter sp.]
MSSEDASRPARSRACCSSSQVRTPKPTGTPERIADLGEPAGGGLADRSRSAGCRRGSPRPGRPRRRGAAPAGPPPPPARNVPGTSDQVVTSVTPASAEPSCERRRPGRDITVPVPGRGDQRPPRSPLPSTVSVRWIRSFIAHLRQLLYAVSRA